VIFWAEQAQLVAQPAAGGSVEPWQARLEIQLILCAPRPQRPRRVGSEELPATQPALEHELLIAEDDDVDVAMGADRVTYELLDRVTASERVLFAVVPDLLDHLRSTFGPSSEVAYDERFELVRTVPLLILDDLGTESATAWAREKLYQIVNHRYNLELPTVITSNRSPDSLDPRVLSRMYQMAFGGEILRISAEDYRRLGAHPHPA
jgi:hypothetical protein